MGVPELGLHQLHAFTVLAQELHFGRAARRLGIAQPPLSQQIRRLEHKVGYPLFERKPGHVTLTAAGRQLLPAAQRALDDVADGLSDARRVGSGSTGRIRLGFAGSLALTVLPALLLEYRERHPDVRLDIREMTTAPQVRGLLDRELDVGLMREPPHEEDLVVERVLSERFVAVLPAHHALAGRRSVDVAELATDEFVLLPHVTAPTVHDRIVGICEASGFQPRVAQHAVEWQTVAALVGAGLGVSIAPESIARIRMPGVVYRRLRPDSERTVVAMVWRRDAASDPLIAHLAEVGRSLRDRQSA
jgi:DNA-binding transcriptional LysR family regulator